MADTARNLIQMTVASVASAGLGTLTLGSAVADFLAFESGDNGLTFTVTITETGVGQEVNTGCTYTHSGTTLTRGTLEKSTTGAAIAFSSAAIVSVVASAGGANAASAVLIEADRAANYGFFVRSDGSTSQTLTDAGWRVIHGGTGGALQTVEWNVGSVWSADSNGRATLPAGRWQIGGLVTVDSVTTSQRLLVGCAKNGEATPSRLLARSGAPAASATIGVAGTTIVESNGSDYFCLVAFVDGSGTHITGATAGFTYFWAEYRGPVL